MIDEITPVARMLPPGPPELHRTLTEEIARVQEEIYQARIAKIQASMARRLAAQILNVPAGKEAK